MVSRVSTEELLLNADLTDVACCHCQQASEKFLKALIEEHGQRIPRTHDLDVLTCQVESIIAVPDDVRTAATFLGGFGVAVRYPGTDSELDDAKDALEMAKTITNWAGLKLQE